MTIEKLLHAARFSQDQIKWYKEGKCFCEKGKPELWLVGKVILLYCKVCQIESLYFNDKSIKKRKLTPKEAFTLTIFENSS